MTSLSTLPAFLASFALAMVNVAVFLLAYTRITPQKEWEQIKKGNGAAALALAGALIGFCLPLASVIAHSAGLADIAVWALVAMIVQIGCFFATYMVVPKICAEIDEGDWAAAITLAGGSVAVGILNAACMTY